MIQLTERDGRAWPLAFDWEEANGDVIRVEIDEKDLREIVNEVEKKTQEYPNK